MKFSTILFSILFFVASIILEAQTFSSQRIISTSADGALYVYSGDIDSDGDSDVLSLSYRDNKIAWYENTDGNGVFGPQQVLDNTIGGGGSLGTGDLNNDGYIDVFWVSPIDMSAFWLRNQDGQGTFSELKTITSGPPIPDHPNHIHAADLDGDGDLDILIADTSPSSGIYWLENTNSQGDFSTIKTIATGEQAFGGIYVNATDLDNDGDMDVLSASFSDNKVAWYKNDGSGSFIQQVITSQANGANSVSAADIDNDGDMDVLSTSGDDNKVAWYENLDGNGTFSSQKVISTSMRGANCAFAADIDNDNDLDVIACSSGDYKIAWYENTDGEGVFGAQQIIDTPGYGPTSIHITDLDNDGDMDVLASIYNNKIAWYENLTVTTSIEEKLLDLPQDFYLYQNYPNPFNPATTIKYNLQNSGNVTIKIFDLTSKEIEVLVNDYKPAGTHSVKWTAEGLPCGVYFYQLRADGFSESKKFILLK